MLKPRQMSHLFITGSKNQMEPVIQELYRHNVFHIEEFVEQTMEGYEGLRIGTPLSGASEAASKLIRIRSIENAFGVKLEDVVPKKRVPVQQLRETIDTKLNAIGSEVEQILAKKSKCETAVKELEQKINELKPFATIPLLLEMYSGYQNLAVFAGRVSKSPDLIVPNETYFSQTNEGNFIAVFAPVEHSGQVQMSLLQANFVAVPVPRGEGLPQDLLNLYTEQIAAYKKEVAQIQEHLEAMKKEQIEFLAACQELLSADVAKAEAPLRFATTKEAFLAEGWVPTDRVDAVRDTLVNATGGKISVTVLPTDLTHDAVPVEYNNPSFAKPTQMLMDIYSRPKYTEIDPTLMVSIVFPIFFGLILGDVGYGLILLVMCFGLRKFLKGEEGSQLLTVLRNASISSIFFGLLYSEFLGFALPWYPIMFSRHLKIGTSATGHGPAIPELMIMSIWIGILHITLGRVISMVNHTRQDHGEHRIKAVLANFGWLAVMWGILLATWSIAALPLMPDLTRLPAIVFGITPGVVIGGVLIVAGVIFIARDSVLEIVEIPTIISHVLSYARIVAVGLSSVAIAMVVNFMAIGMFIEPQLKNFSIFSIFIILAGIAVFFMGHALNVALGILGGGLHSIRLHYVEFFTKFYKGGGIKYKPFGMKQTFTED
jgi:V/A-type H+/Na+-transporting ATPase subunit I